MLQLVQRYKLSILLLCFGILSLCYGIFQWIYQTTPAQSSLNIKHANEKEIYQSINKKVEIPQSDTKSATISSIVKVDVSGAVVNPGVYELPTESRIADAIKQAGDTSKKADTVWIARNLNQATKLKDGDKIFIPSVGEEKQITLNTEQSKNTITPSIMPQVAGVATVQLGLQSAPTNTPAATPPASSQISEKININTASATELDTLPGVGPVTAKKIIESRPYNTLEEIKEKKAVTKSTFEKIKDKITR